MSFVLRQMDNRQLITIINNAIPLEEKICVLRRAQLFAEVTKLVSKFLRDQFNGKEPNLRLIKTVVENTIQIRSCPLGKVKDTLLRMVLIQELEEYVELQLSTQFNAKQAV